MGGYSECCSERPSWRVHDNDWRIVDLMEL